MLRCFYSHKIFKKKKKKKKKKKSAGLLDFELVHVQAAWAGTRTEIKTASDQCLHFCTVMSVRILR